MSKQTNATDKASLDVDLALLKRLWPYAKPNSAQIFGAMLLTPVAMALALVQPWLLKLSIDQHIVPQKAEGLQWLAGLYLASVVLKYFVEAGYTYTLAIAGQHTILRLREGLYKHLLSLAPSFFDKRPAGALLTRATSDIEALGETLGSNVITILLDFLMVSGILVVMFTLNWQLTLVLLAIAPPLAWVLAFFRQQLRKNFLLVRESLARVNAFIAERISGMEIVQLFNYHKYTQEGFIARNTEYRDATIRSNIFDAMMYAVVDGVGTICIALMLWYAISPWGTSAAITIGLLVAFIDYLQRLFKPLQEFSGKIAIIQRATTALIKIFSLLDDKESIQPGALSIKEVEGTIDFEDVHFAYKDEDILRGINLTVKPGEVLAIVGPSGCGKTTLTRLITRSYEGYRGSIKLDGQELSALDLDTVRNNIATVQQDIQLFSESVRFNVSLNNPMITQGDLEHAAQLVHADSFIDDFPEKWGHILRERGANLSVGQGQLLTFARTMAYDPVVVILDEATASIDSETEALVQDAINRILERKTVIVIAHRLSTITAADRIVVMEKGQIKQLGTHEELLQQEGLYKQLYEKGFAE